MTYKETLEYIHSVCWKGSRPGLERTTELMNMLGNPQDKLKFVHVAGTNGKGSVCCMLSNVLRKAGYKTGLYISPYVRYFNERMSVNGMMISNEDLAEITEYVKQYADKMEDKPTEFELITAIAFEYFARENCDIVVLEVGMGGRLDSTNIIKTPVLSVITGIALEHTAFLGDTVEKIAAEKAGIIKEGIPVVYGGDDAKAERVIKETATKRNSEYYSSSERDLSNVNFGLHGTGFDYGEKRGYFATLVGNYQPMNIATAMKSIEILKNNGFNITDDAVKVGLSRVYWPARFEILSEKPTVIYDGAHNPQGLRACVDSIKRFFKNERVVLLSGVMADKDTSVMIPILKEVADRVYTVKPDNPRSMESCEYARRLCEAGFDAIPSDDLKSGVEKAYNYAKENGKVLVALGSLYMYGDVASTIEKIKRGEK